MWPSPNRIARITFGYVAYESAMFIFSQLSTNHLAVDICVIVWMRANIDAVNAMIRFGNALPIHSLVIVKFIFIFRQLSLYQQSIVAFDKYQFAYFGTFRLHVQMVKCQNRSTNSFRYVQRMESFFRHAAKTEQLICIALTASNKQTIAKLHSNTFIKWIKILSHIYIVINLHSN